LGKFDVSQLSVDTEVVYYW